MWNIYFQSWIRHCRVIFLLQCVVKTRTYAAQLSKTAQFNSYTADDAKYILLWKASEDFKNIFGEGQDVFVENDCSVDSCFVSSDRQMFSGDLKKFDAILFSGWDLSWYDLGDWPNKRYSHQKYAYVQKESAAISYICHTGFDNFFNWTITYKLDSDILYPHIYVRDKNENIVGPKINMPWITDLPVPDETVAIDLKSKTKAAAWFYFDYELVAPTHKFVEDLQKALNNVGLKLDIYGKCGPFYCPMHECDQLLEKEYFFYLAIEDSFTEDYVTGNVLRALRNNVVPIVYGGANYSRFLPPESYLDGTQHTSEELAAIMNSLIKNPSLYRRYFRWKSEYRFNLGQATPSLPLERISNSGKTICDLCQSLHDPYKFNVRSEYKDFRKWWYPNYKAKCVNEQALNASLNRRAKVKKRKRCTFQNTRFFKKQHKKHNRKQSQSRLQKSEKHKRSKEHDNNSSSIEIYDENKKYVLLWDTHTYLETIFGVGQEVFLQSDCPVSSCFVTSDKHMFGSDVGKFDAVLFNGWDLDWFAKGDKPDKRYTHQKYAYVQRESAAKAYVCQTGFDNFFNWTITYKLDSDIVYPHIQVRDKNDKIVGPKKNMNWTTYMPTVDTTIAIDLKSKTKVAAWFYLNCKHSNENHQFVENLQNALYRYGSKIDVYGKCGPLHCPLEECDQMLETDYFFYLALEESFAEDYVTGNVLRALQHNVIPIVYGGANYSRFLPPESYLDGTTHTPEELAALMNNLIKSPSLYRRYFRCKSHYSFSLGQTTPSLPLERISNAGQTACDLCQALHDPSKYNVHSAYKDFRKWWYPDYVDKCANESTTETSINTSTRGYKQEKNRSSISAHNRRKHSRKSKKKAKKEGNRKLVKQRKVENLGNGMNHGHLVNLWLAKNKEKVKNGKAGLLRRQFFEMFPNKVAEQLIYGVIVNQIHGHGDWGQGGAGGGVRNAAGFVAVEVSRVRASVFTNNFDIYRR